MQGLSYTPKNRLFFSIDADIRAMFGGAGGGKTQPLLQSRIWQYLHQPYRYGLYHRRNYQHVEQVKKLAQMLLDKVFINCDVILVGDELRFGNGSIYRFGYGGDVSTIQQLHGNNYQDLDLDEVGQTDPKLIETYLYPRLRSNNHYGYKTQITKIGNPEGDYILDVVKEFRFEGTECKHPRAKLIGDSTWFYVDDNGNKVLVQHSTYRDNCFIDQEQYERLVFKNISDLKIRKRMQDGDFTAIEGLVFPEFEEATHVYDPNHLEKPEITNKFLSMDWGVHPDPVSIHLWEVDSSGQIWITDEFYETGNTTGSLTTKIKERGWLGLPCCADPSIAGAGKGILFNPNKPDLSMNIKTSLQSLGWRFVSTNNDIMNGIQIIHDLFAINPLSNRPKVLINRYCVNLIEQLKRYVWDAETGKPSKRVVHHCIDDFRYGAVSWITGNVPIVKELENKILRPIYVERDNRYEPSNVSGLFNKKNPKPVKGIIQRYELYR